MGFALAMENDICTRTKSDDAETRIESAQLGDLAFIVRSIAKKPLPHDDVLLLASILKEALHSSNPVSKKQIFEMILRRGRTKHKAEELSSAIFK